MNYVISFPRSGWHWFTFRAGVFLDKCLNYQYTPGDQEGAIQGKYNLYPGRPIKDTHFGYEPYNFGNQIRFEDVLDSYKNNNKVFLFLRDGKAVLNSLWHLYFNRPETTKFKLLPINEFVCSDKGIQKYCNFLNQTDQFFKDNNIQLEVYYYENNFHVSSISQLPKLLGIDYDLSNEEIQVIFEESSMSFLKKGKSKNIAPSDVTSRGSTYRKGIANDYLNHLSRQACDYIDKYLVENCKLKAYNDFYLT